MNVVMDDATEVYLKADRASVPLGWVYFDLPTAANTTIGRILLKGENITLIQPLIG